MLADSSQRTRDVKPPAVQGTVNNHPIQNVSGLPVEKLSELMRSGVYNNFDDGDNGCNEDNSNHDNNSPY